MYQPFVNRVLKKFFEFLIFRTAQKNLYIPGSPWAQGADSPYQGEMARRAKRGRDAGPKGLRGFERCKFRRTATSCKTLVGTGLCSARQYELFFYGNLRRTRIIFVIDDRFYSVGTHIRNLQLPISIFFYFSKRKRWQKKTNPEGFRFPSGSS